MAGDSTVLNMAVKDLKKTFEGVTSLVEVRGGGAFSNHYCRLMPEMPCTVLDLAPVVANLLDTLQLKSL